MKLYLFIFNLAKYGAFLHFLGSSGLFLGLGSVRVGGGGWLGVVGKSDFNETPVVSLDLDLDFGLRLRVCQHHILIHFDETQPVDEVHHSFVSLISN